MDIWSFVRLAELWVVKRDLKASDLSSISWMERLVAAPAEDLAPLETLEDPEGPATAARSRTTFRMTSVKPFSNTVLSSVH